MVGLADRLGSGGVNWQRGPVALRSSAVCGSESSAGDPGSVTPAETALPVLEHRLGTRSCPCATWRRQPTAQEQQEGDLVHTQHDAGCLAPAGVAAPGSAHGTNMSSEGCRQLTCLEKAETLPSSDCRSDP